MATTAALAGLHDAIADIFLKKLQSDAPLSASELSVIVKFLKDNDITAAPVPQAKTTQIARILPFPTGDESNIALEG